ncbi:MAG: metal-sensitive transcriptional regulator [Clostridia bacterium]|nr:metal-sensitive transcriptional regulator [Clostridia bacterium]
MSEHIHSHLNHTHTHNAEQTKKIQNRLKKAIGHLEGVVRMIDDNRDCIEVMYQLNAVIAAIKSTNKVILNEHINHCIAHAIKEGDEAAISELEEIINKFVK